MTTLTGVLPYLRDIGNHNIRQLLRVGISYREILTKITEYLPTNHCITIVHLYKMIIANGWLYKI